MGEELQVLIVDDSEDDREFYQELLSEDDANSWASTEAACASECLALVEDFHFDCVLLDYSLPARNGVELMAEIRQLNHEVPVVMLTGQGSERIAVDAMKAGVQDYLPKDEISADLLPRIIQSAMAQMKKQLELMRRANYDHLTGLAGRALLMDRLGRAVTRSERNAMPFCLMFIDLDGFKAVNDRYGHQCGDRLLKAVAGRLVGCLRENDTVARLGGDEFVVLAEELLDDGREVTQRLIERVHRVITSESYPIECESVQIGASIGAAIYPWTARSPRMLLELADKAMYEAKRSSEHVSIVAAPRD